MSDQHHPSTSVDVHLLVRPDQLPAVQASASILQGSESVFARLEVDDMPAGDRARHRVGFSLSGPRATVLAVLDQLRDTVRSTPVPLAGGEPQ